MKITKNKPKLHLGRIVMVWGLFLCLFSSVESRAQFNRSQVKHLLFSDTLNVNQALARKSNTFYDSLQARSSRSWFFRTVTSWLIRSASENDSSQPNMEFENSQHYFQQFEGDRISAIRIVQANVFERSRDEKMSWGERFVDGLHVLTSEKQLRQNLLFHVGDTIDPRSMAINEILIRNLPYISTSFIVISRDMIDTTNVVVNIFARDNWTISGDASIGGTSNLKLYDRNFLGSGDMLSLQYTFGEPRYESLEAIYAINNLGGSFADVTARLGVGRVKNRAQLEVIRPYILSDDVFYGGRAGYEQDSQLIASRDMTMLVNKSDYALWAGYSWGINVNKGTNFYTSFGLNSVKFNKRPEIIPGDMPYFYNSTTALMNLGFSSERFLQGNMIYGYGRIEDIPYGFKFETTMGVQWNEVLGKRLYLGAKLLGGDYYPFGYLQGAIGAGSFLNCTTGELEQSVVRMSLRYFSPLIRAGRQYFRQFVSATVINGFNRMTGDGERLGFLPTADIRGVGADWHQMATNRLTVSAESVMFSSLFLYHFRFAFFAWGDCGWLGDNPNHFKNSFSAAIGVGVRIKNERLIFGSFQFRFGIALNNPLDMRYNGFQFATYENLILNRFNPEPPAMLPYN